MSLSVVVMPRAEADLREIANWWATNRSSEQAGRWLDGIFEAIGSLSENPDRRPRAREDRRHRYELRELHFGLGSRATHRVIFTIRPEKVVVLTVRHLAQDDWDAV